MSEGKRISKGQGTMKALGGGIAEASNGERDLDSVRRDLELVYSNREKGPSGGGDLPSGVFGGEAAA